MLTMALELWSLLRLLLIIPLVFGTDRVKPQASEDTIILVTDWGTPGRILNVSLQHMNFSTVPASDTKRPVAVDYDPADDKVYWTDVFLEQIRSTDIRTQTDTILVQLNKSATPDGIAVDSTERVVFYTDAGNNMVMRIDMGSQQSKVIADKDLQEPRAIVIHRENRKVYWTDWGLTPKIESAGYDGADREVLVSTGLAWPNGLALDRYNERLFWCDAKRSVIESILLDGSDRKLILSESTAHYFDLFYHQGVLYFTDWQRPKSLLHVPACGGTVGFLVSGGFNKLAGLHVISRTNTGQNYNLLECSDKCIHCRKKTTCDVVSGLCPGGCKTGWTGDTCSTVVETYVPTPITTTATSISRDYSEDPNNTVVETSVPTPITTTATSISTDYSEDPNNTGQPEVTSYLGDIIYPDVGLTLEESQPWMGLSLGMTVAVVLGSFSLLLLVAIVILLVIHRRKGEKERFNNLSWAGQQTFTNNTYTLMAGDAEDRHQLYLIPLDDPLKANDEPDHMYEDIDQIKMEIEEEVNPLNMSTF